MASVAGQCREEPPGACGIRETPALHDGGRRAGQSISRTNNNGPRGARCSVKHAVRNQAATVSFAGAFAAGASSPWWNCSSSVLPRIAVVELWPLWMVCVTASK